MMILVLNEKTYPKNFNNHNDISTGNKSIVDFENQIIDLINDYNHHIKLEKIVYSDVLKIDQTFGKTKFNGLIGEVFSVEEFNERTGKNVSANISINGEEWFFDKRIYVYLSPVKEESRNITFSQTIFPGTIDVMSNGIETSNYKLMNMPTYLINIIDTKITSSSLMQTLYSINLLEIDVISFSKDNRLEYCRDLKHYLDLTGITSNVINSSVEIDVKEKKLKVKASDGLLGLKTLADNSVDFNGSSEKFYWMNIIPFVLSAVKEQYTVDLDELYNFISQKRSIFKSGSNKFIRLENLALYFKKITEKGE